MRDRTGRRCSRSPPRTGRRSRTASIATRMFSTQLSESKTRNTIDPPAAAWLHEVADRHCPGSSCSRPRSRPATASGTADWAWPRAARQAFQGSSLRKRSATSKVAPPRIPARTVAAACARKTGATASMSAVRMRVANSDWCASRIVVSVSSTRCSHFIHSAKPLGPSSFRRSRVPVGRVPARHAAGAWAGAGPARRQRAALHLAVAVDGHLAEKVSRRVARSRRVGEAEQFRRARR